MSGAKCYPFSVGGIPALMTKQLSIAALLGAVLLSQQGCIFIATRSYNAAVDTRSVKDHWADGKIRARIRKKYYDDEDMKVLAITPYVYYGRVYLIGEYENQAQKTKALTLARQVDGVKAVIPYLLPKKEKDFCGAADEIKIKAKVKSRLIKDKDIWATNVHVDTVQCRIVLLGLVGTQAEIRRAIKHAKSVPGVRGVKSYLRAVKKEPWKGASNKPRKKPKKKPVKNPKKKWFWQ